MFCLLKAFILSQEEHPKTTGVSKVPQRKIAVDGGPRLPPSTPVSRTWRRRWSGGAWRSRWRRWWWRRWSRGLGPTPPCTSGASGGTGCLRWTLPSSGNAEETRKGLYFIQLEDSETTACCLPAKMQRWWWHRFHRRSVWVPWRRISPGCPRRRRCTKEGCPRRCRGGGISGRPPLTPRGTWPHRSSWSGPPPRPTPGAPRPPSATDAIESKDGDWNSARGRRMMFILSVFNISNDRFYAYILYVFPIGLRNMRKMEQIIKVTSQSLVNDDVK